MDNQMDGRSNTDLSQRLRRGLLVMFAMSLLTAVASINAAEKKPLNDRQVLKAMMQELDRSVDTLSKREPPLHYLSYELTSSTRSSVSASFGHVDQVFSRHNNLLDIDVRVGSPSLDNKREMRNARAQANRTGSVRIPINDANAIRTHIWRATDLRYKLAAERLQKVQADMQMRTQDETEVDDFSNAKKVRGFQKSVALNVDREVWKQKLAKYTVPFARHETLVGGRAFFSAESRDVYFVNSEGSSIKTAEHSFRVSISASAQDDDGSNVYRYQDFYTKNEAELPDDQTIVAAAEKLGQEVIALLDAEDLAVYNGPAILSGRATGVFFHEVLGHRLEGHRLKSTSDAQTFKEKVGEAILPKSFSVYFDPTMTHYGDTALNGSYDFDNEGVQAKRVDIVEDGILKSFLMSRSPISGFEVSNGHGRKAVGFSPVSRQSNLIVEVSETVSKHDLKQQLLELVNESGLEYGLLIDDITGGFTFTDRTMPNSFRVSPTVVYKIYADGREELVRGVNLIGTPLTAFSNIVAASDDYNVFNGTCGAESGPVPVSAVAPAILINQVEVQKQQKSQESLPILPPPAQIPNGV